MRQFFSWRIWAAFAAVVALAVLWKAAAPDGGVTGSGLDAPKERTVQFVSLVYEVKPSAGFTIAGGVVAGSADLVIDGQRTMHIVPGTPGEIACAELTVIGRCVVLADLLGEAVVWFTLQPVATGLKVEAPPIVELLEDGVARLENGWLVPLANGVDIQCDDDEEVGSLSEFIEDQGPDSETIIDVSQQRITQVVCANATPETTTTSTTPPFTVVTDPALIGETTTVVDTVLE